MKISHQLFSGGDDGGSGVLGMESMPAVSSFGPMPMGNSPIPFANAKPPAPNIFGNHTNINLSNHLLAVTPQSLSRTSYTAFVGYAASAGQASNRNPVTKFNIPTSFSDKSEEANPEVRNNNIFKLSIEF